ncbi:MAG: hypothetical protein PHN68_02235 [Prolixibacteraceae bacterium]|jgi:hypothetical protein|nr:hypothetical protein [Prolixibacteraceae bacterium]MDD4755098.1 hypothetical protein [Prolixibacteraceae bacterium]NLO02022.1 hypothetical protein [Bacteroidales bacterium]
MKRIEFIRRGGRILILGAMAAVSGWLLTRPDKDTNCSVSPACKRCSKFSECELPKAEKK